MINKDFSFYVTKFFSEYLPHHKNLSANTISLYRDCFVLFLKFCDEYKNMNPTDIDVISIEDDQKFLFSNGQHPIKPSIGKTYIQNPYKPQEYVEMTDHILKDFETSRKNKYFELAHLLGATKIE